VEEEGSEPIGFYNLGVAFLNAARAAASAENVPHFDEPVQFLVAHGLELIFKADQRRTQSLETVRKKFGHDLLKLHAGLSEDFIQDFMLDSEFEMVVMGLSQGHSGPDWRNRYLQTGFRSELPAERLIAAVRAFTVEDRGWLISHFARQGH
jgi:hypothetical protein